MDKVEETVDFHYKNMPMQYTEICLVVKNIIFHLKFFNIFLIFTQNIYCGYTLDVRTTSARRF